jgi:hypothetical protein
MPPKQKTVAIEPASPIDGPATPKNDEPKTCEDDINTENWDLHKDFYFYFVPNSGKLETKELKKGGPVRLFTIDGIGSDGAKILVEVWGDSEAALFHRMFETAAKKGQALFRINPITCVDENDAETLILIPCAPIRFKSVTVLCSNCKEERGVVSLNEPKWLMCHFRSL